MWRLLTQPVCRMLVCESDHVVQTLCIKSIALIEFESMLLMISPNRDLSWVDWVYDETRRRYVFSGVSTWGEERGGRVPLNFGFHGRTVQSSC